MRPAYDRYMIEVLESRFAPALAAQFSLGQLTITGSAFFDCQIYTERDGAITVRDGTQIPVFGPVHGVRDIDVLLGGPSNDVFLAIAGYVGRTDIVFGHGNNEVIVGVRQGIPLAPSGDLSIVSGDGNDSLLVSPGVVFRNLQWNAYGGSNRLELGGSVEGAVRITAGAGNDTVIVQTEGIGKALELYLGSGTNNTTLSGPIGETTIVGEGGADTLLVDSLAVINGALDFRPGMGANDMTVEGRVRGGTLYTGGKDSDVVAVSLGSLKRIVASLGPGMNEFKFNGSADDVIIQGGNDNDIVSVGEFASATGNVTFNGGGGSNRWDSVSEGIPIKGRLKITGGDGDDAVVLDDAVHKQILLRLGDGENTVNIRGVGVTKLSYVGGSGVDRIEVQDSGSNPFGFGDFRLGGGADIVSYSSQTPVFAKLRINGGQGRDTFDGTHETASIPVELRSVENLS